LTDDKGRTVDTPFTDSEAIEHLRRIAEGITEASESNRKFARDLWASYCRFRSLTPNRLFWAHRLAVEAINGPPEKPKPVSLTNFDRIVQMFKHAKSKLEFPKVKFKLPRGETLQLSILGEGSKRPGCINVTNGRSFPRHLNKWYGCISQDGQYDPSYKSTPEVVEFLKSLSENPEQVAGTQGKASGCCCFCSRALEDERSLLVGYGPVCAERWGLTWGERP
jgi:hypothetical protein